MPPTSTTRISARTTKRQTPVSQASAHSSTDVSLQALPAPKVPALLDGPITEERIRLRAYDLYERRGHIDGQAMNDWLAAESELHGR